MFKLAFFNIYIKIMISIDLISVSNFKSIEDCFLDFEGFRLNGVSAGILVGVNESGKSSLLEAISMIGKDWDNLKYNDYFHMSKSDSNEDIGVTVIYRVDNIKKMQFLLSKEKKLPKSFLSLLAIREIGYSQYLGSDQSSMIGLDFVYDETDFSDFLFELSYGSDSDDVIRSIVNKNDIKKEQQNTYEEILDENLQDYLREDIHSILEKYRPEILIWKSSPEYLINKPIDLKDFSLNPDGISIPLRNIFNIYGKRTNEEIEFCISNALVNPAKKARLVDEMSESISKYINKVWGEHNIRVKIDIDGGKCNVLIEDVDNKYSYYNMEQRSEGFKQFFSLILSLSTLNESKSLKNKVILIDEPEVHLHPSGIQYMREELLRIAKNNIVLISTHSQFMIDVNCPERHFIVSKQKGVTSIKQVDDSTNFKDDSVLKSAFGLNLYKELLPQKIIVVEGGDDKCFLDHCLAIYSVNSSFSIKAAGGASKIPGFASLLSGESLSPSILFDADKEGMDCRKKILDNIKTDFTKNNVFILTDICSELPKNSTIEDLYPLDFINKELVEKMSPNTVLDSEVSVLEQLSKDEVWSKLDKQQKESAKVKLSKSFLENYKTKKSLDSIPRLKLFIENFIDKMNL